MPEVRLLTSRLALALALAVCALLTIAVISACDSGAPTPTPANVGTPTGLPVAASGAAVFMRNCNVCHPGGGRGSGPSLIELGPRLSDDQIEAVVRNGKDRMPAYNQTVITDEQLGELVGYIRTLK